MNALKGFHVRLSWRVNTVEGHVAAGYCDFGFEDYTRYIIGRGYIVLAESVRCQLYVRRECMTRLKCWLYLCVCFYVWEQGIYMYVCHRLLFVTDVSVT